MNRTSILVAAALLLQMGCTPRPTLVGFSDQITKTNKKLNDMGAKFNLAAALALKNPAKISELDKAYEDAKSTVEKIKGEWAYGKLPKHPSQAAPDFLDAYKKFLEGQETIVSHMDKIVTAFHDNNLDARGKEEVYWTETKAMRDIDVTTLGALLTAQQKYAKEHFFQVGTPQKK
jgi:hypothetical protein